MEGIVPSLDHALLAGVGDIISKSGIRSIEIGKATGEASLLACTRHRLGKLEHHLGDLLSGD